MCERDLLSLQLCAETFGRFQHFVFDGVVEEVLSFVNDLLVVLDALESGEFLLREVDLFCHFSTLVSRGTLSD